MRLLFLLAFAAFIPAAIHAATPALLAEAWTKYVADIDHWAYTETTRALNAKGETTRETVTRYDPSLPYAEQFVVVKHTGKPSLEQMQQWARQRGINRGERLERPGGVEHDAQPRIMLNGAPALADLDGAVVLAEDAQTITYSIPLRSEGRKGSRVDKFETRVRISRTRQAFDRVDIFLPQPMRMKGVAKLNQLTISIDFATVESTFSPTATVFKDYVSASVFFRKREGGHESVRTEFKRVKPYRDRFGVKVGPSRTIDF